MLTFAVPGFVFGVNQGYLFGLQVFSYTATLFYFIHCILSAIRWRSFWSALHCFQPDKKPTKHRTLGEWEESSPSWKMAALSKLYISDWLRQWFREHCFYENHLWNRCRPTSIKSWTNSCTVQIPEYFMWGIYSNMQKHSLSWNNIFFISF